jgi:imidazolonepropionase-like amidohydrolase
MFPHRASFLFFCVVFLIAVSSALSQLTEEFIALKCGKVIDGESDNVQENVTILIQGNKITAVGKSVTIPPNARIIDLSQSTVMPGFIDSHTHMLLHEGDYNDQLFKESVAYRAIYATVNARKTLEAGFTTIRDLETEGAMYADVALRDAINKGLVPGPRIQASTRSLGITGGYSPYGFAPEHDIPYGAQIADGVDGVRKAVREQVRNGADVIKVYADHRRGRDFGDDTLRGFLTFSLEELKVVVEEASNVGLKVAAHVYTSEAAQRSAMAGIASIEHGLYLDEPTLQLMKQKGVYWVPTMIAYLRSLDNPNMPPAARRRSELTTSRHRETFQRALKVGVKIAFGSDLTGDHGTNAREFEVMVRYGMPPMKAIQSGTSVAAELLGWQNKIGSIEVGKLADIVAAPGNPLNDIKLLQKVNFVMKDGRVVR